MRSHRSAAPAHPAIANWGRANSSWGWGPACRWLRPTDQQRADLMDAHAINHILALLSFDDNDMGIISISAGSNQT